MQRLWVVAHGDKELSFKVLLQLHGLSLHHALKLDLIVRVNFLVHGLVFDD
jgi:hypothetical protein